MLKFDFAFIDGDHTFEGVKNDFSLVSKCGRVLFHDYDTPKGSVNPVRKFIDTLDKNKIEARKDFALWTNK
jgi:hypothetical protein